MIFACLQRIAKNNRHFPFELTPDPNRIVFLYPYRTNNWTPSATQPHMCCWMVCCCSCYGKMLTLHIEFMGEKKQWNKGIDASVVILINNSTTALPHPHPFRTWLAPPSKLAENVQGWYTVLWPSCVSVWCAKGRIIGKERRYSHINWTLSKSHWNTIRRTNTHRTIYWWRNRKEKGGSCHPHPHVAVICISTRTFFSVRLWFRICENSSYSNYLFLLKYSFTQRHFSPIAIYTITWFIHLLSDLKLTNCTTNADDVKLNVNFGGDNIWSRVTRADYRLCSYMYIHIFDWRLVQRTDRGVRYYTEEQ